MNKACLLLLFSLACASGQTLSKRVLNAALSGRVLDDHGAPVDSAEVVAISPEGQRFATATASDGRFAFFKLDPGEYNLVVQKEGYDTISSANGRVRDGQDLSMEIPLHPAKAFAQMAPPVFLYGPSLSYTDEALSHKVQGVAVAKCIITVEGRVTKCRTLRSVQYMDEAVIKQLEARKYKPALLEGKPIEVDYTFKVNLHL